jgi:hypothetical protein
MGGVLVGEILTCGFARMRSANDLTVAKDARDWVR